VINSKLDRYINSPLRSRNESTPPPMQRPTYNPPSKIIEESRKLVEKDYKSDKLVVKKEMAAKKRHDPNALQKKANPPAKLESLGARGRIPFYPSFRGQIDHEVKSEPAGVVCPVHFSRTARLYCRTCRSPFCSRCIIMHKMHDYCDINDVAGAVAAAIAPSETTTPQPTMRQLPVQ
jgi:hypothetical protein